MENTLTDEMKIISYLTFSIGEEHFGLNVAGLINILEMQKLTQIPKAPKYISGIINLRGEVLPVIDAKIKLGLGQSEITTNTCILVIEALINKEKVRFGAIVDSVHEVLEIDDDKILPPPGIANKFETNLILGVVEQNDKFVMVLDINQFLELSEAEALKSIQNTTK